MGFEDDVVIEFLKWKLTEPAKIASENWAGTRLVGIWSEWGWKLQAVDFQKHLIPFMGVKSATAFVWELWNLLQSWQANWESSASGSVQQGIPDNFVQKWNAQLESMRQQREKIALVVDQASNRPNRDGRGQSGYGNDRRDRDRDYERRDRDRDYERRDRDRDRDRERDR